MDYLQIKIPMTLAQFNAFNAKFVHPQSPTGVKVMSMEFTPVINNVISPNVLYINAAGKDLSKLIAAVQAAADAVSVTIDETKPLSKEESRVKEGVKDQEK